MSPAPSMPTPALPDTAAPATGPLAAGSPLLRPLTAGTLAAPNRVWMAPMSRHRADPDGTPNALMARYYAQRAGAGVIISEGTQPSAVGQGNVLTPGLHTDAHQAGWAEVAGAVHAAGGRLIVQLMHVGRNGHADANGGQQLVSSTDRPPPWDVVTTTGRRPASLPRALATSEVPEVVAEYADAARRAVDAGADGIELHGANGYLIHQFLGDRVNDRTDAYGGPPEQRARFALEVVRACADAIGADRVGLRLSPGNLDQDDDTSVYDVLVAGLPADLAYLHLLADADDPVVARLRAAWPGVFVLCNGFFTPSDRDVLERLVADGVTDAVAVGRAFIANPDLVDRWSHGTALNPIDPETFYTGGPRGYTDQPAVHRTA